MIDSKKRRGLDAGLKQKCLLSVRFYCIREYIIKMMKQQSQKKLHNLSSSPSISSLFMIVLVSYSYKQKQNTLRCIEMTLFSSENDTSPFKKEVVIQTFPCNFLMQTLNSSAIHSRERVNHANTDICHNRILRQR